MKRTRKRRRRSRLRGGEPGAVVAIEGVASKGEAVAETWLDKLNKAKARAISAWPEARWDNAARNLDAGLVKAVKNSKKFGAAAREKAEDAYEVTVKTVKPFAKKAAERAQYSLNQGLEKTVKYGKAKVDSYGWSAESMSLKDYISSSGSVGGLNYVKKQLESGRNKNDMVLGSDNKTACLNMNFHKFKEDETCKKYLVRGYVPPPKAGGSMRRRTNKTRRGGSTQRRVQRRMRRRTRRNTRRKTRRRMRRRMRRSRKN